MTKDQSDNKSLMVFPCDFKIKIMGLNTKTFSNDIYQIVCKHFPDTKTSAMSTQQSREGNFLSITVTIHVLDQQTLDALYIELTKHPDIKMVL